MNGELSNGLAALRTAGNRIVSTATGQPVLLRGVNRSGLEYAGPDEQGFLSGASLSRAEIQFIVQEWRCNILRIPFNQDFVLHGRSGRSGEEYRQALDQIIYWASLYGAYTLLDLQWLDAERIYGGDRNFVAPLPNIDSIELWSTLARRYKAEPAVLYDVFNEPHDRLADDPYPLNKEDGATYPANKMTVTMQEWQPSGGRHSRQPFGTRIPRPSSSSAELTGPTIFAACLWTLRISCTPPMSTPTRATTGPTPSATYRSPFPCSWANRGR